MIVQRCRLKRAQSRTLSEQGAAAANTVPTVKENVNMQVSESIAVVAQ